MNRIFEWSLLELLIILLRCGVTKSNEPNLKVVAPTSHVALSGNVTVFILRTSDMEFSTVSTIITSNSSTNDIRKDERDKIDSEKEGSSRCNKSFALTVLYIDGLTSEFIGNFPLDTLPSKDENTSVIIPCGVFSRGGVYTLQIKSSTEAAKHNTAITGLSEIEMSSALDVKWPIPSLLLESHHFGTYPTQPVVVIIKYNEVLCVPVDGVPVAAYNLKLIYCGTTDTACDPQNNDRTQVLFYKEITGFTSPRVIKLDCDLFGLAGNYALRLKASNSNPSAPTISAYIKVEWSSEYSFNVHAKSIYPCEGSTGISVLFQYPACRLDGDRVRVYGRLQADVSSLAPPTALHYVAELTATLGKHSLNFDCDIFTEKFIEYCFIYVSQAFTGAMAEVKLACIPTFPLLENNTAGWGPWSEWSPCSSSCIGGTRTRYRFCDTPPPKYGGKFCQGKAVETESCGGADGIDFQKEWNAEGWECRHGTILAAARPEIKAHIGEHCRCGCSIYFQDETLNRLLAASTQACPGRSFWFLHAQSNYTIQLRLDQAQFPCPGQYLRARDGDSMNAELLMDIGYNKGETSTRTIVSSGQSLLLEFISDELSAADEICAGGFLGHASMFHKMYERSKTSSPLEINSTTSIEQWISWEPGFLATASILILVLFIFIFLAILQCALGYRKYHRAEDLDSLTEPSECSGAQHMMERMKAVSSTTLISEVASLMGKCTPRLLKRKRAPCAMEDGYDSSETLAEYEDETSLSLSTLKQKDNEETLEQSATPSDKPHIEATSKTILAIIPDNQPEVKYARPVKLRTLGSDSTAEDKLTSNDTRYTASSSIDSSHIARLHRPTSNLSQTKKESSTNSPLSGTSTLSRGKETKERRNRERLLQGPGSEFSLTNPETDMELDYYDYNVVNAGAAPGSYLGMDPTFLLWIPPLSMSEDSEDPSAARPVCSDYFQSARTTSPTLSRLPEGTEGVTLTPAEYRRMRHQVATNVKEACRLSFEQKRQDSTSSSSSKNDSSSGGSVLSEDSLGSESRTARLNERLLPIHRILEDSRIRVSEESLCSQLTADRTVQIHGTKSDLSQDTSKSSQQNSDVNINKPDPKSEFIAEKSRQTSKRHLEDVGNCATSSFHVNKRTTDSHEDKKHHCFANETTSKSSGKSTRGGYTGGKDKDSQNAKDDSKNLNTTSGQCKSRDFNQFTPSRETTKLSDCTNIPMIELSGPRLSLSMTSRRLATDALNINLQKEIQSPDYGVESDMNAEPHESFYNLLHENEDGIKFADDDDEYIDNRVNLFNQSSCFVPIAMRLLSVFGVFILWQVQSGVSITQYPNSDVATRACKNVESSSSVYRLRKQIFCNYDNTVLPTHPKTDIFFINLKLVPKMMEFTRDIGILSLHSWISIVWKDPSLTWIPSEYEDITEIHVKSWEIWRPNLCVFNSGDMSNYCNLQLSDCLLYSKGTVACVSAEKFTSICNADNTYWPYEIHQCNITFGFWGHKAEEVNFRINKDGIDMTNFNNDTQWDFKFVHSVSEIKQLKCCPNKSYPTITYNFLLTRHYDINHISHVIPTIVLMLFTILVLWLDPNSIERMLVASVNFIGHLIWIFHLFWNLPFNGTNPPNLILYYGESMALATYAIILTALLRKLQDTNTKMPNWISSTTSFVLSNKAGRFLISNDKDFEMTDEDATNEGISELPKSKEMKIKELSWRHFASIVSWLSLFCVVFVYIIIFIIFTPVRFNL
ncbi:uncharacterized protein LOC109859524 [Pseudomyrmex gracilis]|uniref:uncharacterized protein LOC109859524 n=1 Tax=Pseudomyrmex gracilis TaxID=219809 RepID=UPI00099579DA|nr:uncharacterized protein LOC109859524 [Pseudomyrmex gracilis]